MAGDVHDLFSPPNYFYSRLTHRYRCHRTPIPIPLLTILIYTLMKADAYGNVSSRKQTEAWDGGDERPPTLLHLQITTLCDS